MKPSKKTKPTKKSAKPASRKSVKTVAKKSVAKAVSSKKVAPAVKKKVPLAKTPDGGLREVQQWVQDVIMHSDGVNAGVAQSAANGAYDISGKKPHEIIGRSKNLTSFERIEIYANMYFWRLLECMENDFSTTREAMGYDTFQRVVSAYLDKYPSKSFTLQHLGEKFAAFLKKEGRALHLENIPFLADLADFERALEDVFDAAKDPVLTVEQLREIPAESWPGASLKPVSAFRVRKYSHPVNDYHEAVLTAVREEKIAAARTCEVTPEQQSGGSNSAVCEHHQQAGHDKPRIPIPKKKTVQVIIYRREYTVWRLEIGDHEYRILKKLAAGDAIGDAILSALTDEELADPGVIERIRNAFEDWTARGIFTAVII